MPARQQWMKIRAVSSHLPQSGGVSSIIGDSESNAVVVRRENGADWFTLHSGDTSGLTAVGFRHPDV